MALTLQELLAPPDRSSIMQKLLLSLQGTPGFPVTDWESGGVERTIVEMEADTLTDLVATGIPTMVGGGFLDYANGDWLTFLAAQLYQLERHPATFTQQAVTLHCTTGAGPITVNERQLWMVAASGLRYNGPVVTATDPGPWVVPDGGDLVVTFESEHPNDSIAGLNYIDPAQTLQTLQTQVAGLSGVNLAFDFSPVGLTGTGTGTITPSRTVIGVQPDPHAFDIVIVAVGDIGIATFKWRMDGGAYSAPILVPASYALPGGTTITFADGAGTPNSFIPGDVFNFSTPGSPITQQGTDEENDGSLRQRCRARWPSLGVIPTEDKYASWAKEASKEVTRVRVSQDLVVAGQVNLVLAGQAGPVSAGVVTTVRSYILAREGIGDLSTVASAVELPITIAGTVKVPTALLPSVKASVQLMWLTAVNSTDIEGQVLLSTLNQILRNAGASDTLGLTINGLAANVQLGPTEVATFPGLVTNQLTWVGTG